MSDVLIDLGEVPPTTGAPAGRVTPRPPFPFRVLLAAASLALVTLLAGAAHHSPPRPPSIIPARLGDSTFVDGRQLFVISAGLPALGADVSNRVISTYSLPEGTLTGRTTVAASGGVNGVWQGAGTMVVTYQTDSNGTWTVVALRAGTQQALWRHGGRVAGASAADGLVLVETDEAVLGVDLTTGHVRWSVPRPADGFTAAAGDDAGFPRWLITVADSGLLETRDSRTGAVLAAKHLPPMRGRANGLIWPVGDLILVDTAHDGFEGYRLPGLIREFRTTADLSRSWTQADCGRLICTFRQQTGMTALDPVTGHEMWESERWAYAEAAGPYLLATQFDNATEQPSIWVLDPATGRPLGNFGKWEGLGPVGDGRYYGKLDVPGQYQVFYGVLDPATQRVTVLGRGDRVSGDCETADGVLLCRLIDATIALWRLG